MKDCLRRILNLQILITQERHLRKLMLVLVREEVEASEKRLKMLALGSIQSWEWRRWLFQADHSREMSVMRVVAFLRGILLKLRSVSMEKLITKCSTFKVSWVRLTKVIRSWLVNGFVRRQHLPQTVALLFWKWLPMLASSNTYFNPSSPNINIHILLTILLIFLMLLVGRIWLKIKAIDNGWLFPLFSWPVCLTK